MSDDSRYAVLLRSASRLKLRGTSLLAEGEALFDAAVLFHSAAYELTRARTLLDPADDVALLANDIERCWCLLDGYDPAAAAKVWRLIQPRRGLTGGANHLVARLRPRWVRDWKNFSELFYGTRFYKHVQKTQIIVPLPEGLHAEFLAEVERVLATYPGCIILWWFRYRVSLDAGNSMDAWSALEAAAKLDPGSEVFAALRLSLAPTALGREGAQAYLAAAIDIDSASAVECLQFALAAVRLDDPRNAAWMDLAEKVARTGAQRSQPGRFRSYLRVTIRAIDAQRHGLPITTRMLREEGLADLIPAKAPEESGVNVSQVVAAASREMAELHAP